MQRFANENEASAIYEKLRQVIGDGAIRPLFQPIISLRDAEVLGYEALSRGPEGTELESPDALFLVAENCQCLWDLECLCRTKALHAFQASGAKALLFLNVNPSVIEDAKFKTGFTKEYLTAFGIDPEDIVFEITERRAILNNGEFRQVIGHYKEQNYKIAIDDAGAGYAGLNMISDVQPHYLKLDMNLIRGIDKDTVKQALVKSMQEFSRITDTYLIAEGIETIAELEMLVHIGVHYGQGYFIQRPAAAISPIQPEVIHAIIDTNARRNHLRSYHISEIYIGNLCVDALLTEAHAPIAEVYDRMDKAHEVAGFCVVDGGVVQGVVTSNQLNAVVAGVYGYSLYSRKAVSDIMDTDFLCMDYKTPVNVAGKLAMARHGSKVYDFITVTMDGKYYGIVTIRDLLDKTIEIEVAQAAQMNPLTMLPGNVLIEKALDEALRSSVTRYVLYFDIDNFKAYNDVYGFENGDRMIVYLAKLIASAVSESDFVGHIGGDDFVAIVASQSAAALCQRMIDEFGSGTAALFNEQDRMNGFLTARNRRGVEEQYPLVTLSIAGIATRKGRYPNVYALSAEASRIKKECKMAPGGAYIIR